MLQTLPHRASDDSSALEATVSHLQGEVRELQRALHARSAELAGADAQISLLQEKVLKLKDAQRELKRIKREREAQGRSAWKKLAHVLRSPLRFLKRAIAPSGSSRKSAATVYQAWLDRQRASPADVERMRRESRAFSRTPLISIIMPVFNTPVEWLREAIDSVLAQAYENWELLLVDDASTERSTIDLLGLIEQRDPRLRVIRRVANGGISAASNVGLAEARGEWIGLLDHDDLLEPDALFQTAQLLQTRDDVDLVYSDEDKLTEEGFASPMLKPDWSPDYFLSYNYLCHFVTFRRALAQNIGGFRSEFDGSQDYDLLLRMIEQTDRIHHIPRVLYHWRKTDRSVADNIFRKPGALEAGRRAIAGHLERTGRSANVAVDWRTHAYWVRRDLITPSKISIVTSSGDSLVGKIDYSNFEKVTVDRAGQSNSKAVVNRAVAQTTSPWILFLGDGVEPVDNDWLTLMAEHVQRPEVGAVGARLISRDEKIEHAGVVTGVDGIAQPAFRGFKAEAAGVCRQLQITRNYSAVSGVCLLTRREVFLEVGGFDEQLPDALADIDLCLKMRRAGYLVVYTPFAKLYRETPGKEGEIDDRSAAIMRERWPEALQRDPYYNPNLSRSRADFSVGN